ncbi:MAG: hypothetical protein ACRCZJ_03595 [Erysipelotrichaceae bacterium]
MKKARGFQNKEEAKQSLAQSLYDHVMNMNFDELEDTFLQFEEVMTFRLIPNPLGLQVRVGYEEYDASEQPVGEELNEDEVLQKLAELLKQGEQKKRSFDA